MGSPKLIATFIILLSLFLLWANSQGKLLPAMQIVTTEQAGDSTVSPTLKSAGAFLLAFAIYVVALSFMSPQNGFRLTLVLVLGALLVNQRLKGNDAIIPQLFGTSGGEPSNE